MTPCERAQQGLLERLDGSLKLHELATLETHLVHCASCRQELARHAALVAALEALPEADVPKDFTRRVMSDLPEMLPRSEGAGHVLRWGIAVAALLSGTVIGVAMLVNGGGPEAARQALQPLGASFQLGGILLAQAAAGLALGLSVMSEALSATGFSAPLVVVLFAAANAALLAMLAKLRPDDAER